MPRVLNLMGGSNSTERPVSSEISVALVELASIASAVAVAASTNKAIFDVIVEI